MKFWEEIEKREEMDKQAGKNVVDIYLNIHNHHHPQYSQNLEPTECFRKYMYFRVFINIGERLNIKAPEGHLDCFKERIYKSILFGSRLFLCRHCLLYINKPLIITLFIAS